MFNHYLDEIANPMLCFEDNVFKFSEPILEFFRQDKVRVTDFEEYTLSKKEILEQFAKLFRQVQSDAKKGIEHEIYESNIKDKELGFILIVDHESGAFDLAIDYAKNISVYEYPLYPSRHNTIDNTSELYDELIEDSHILFHGDLMELAKKNKSAFKKLLIT